MVKETFRVISLVSASYTVKAGLRQRKGESADDFLWRAMRTPRAPKDKTQMIIVVNKDLSPASRRYAIRRERERLYDHPEKEDLKAHALMHMELDAIHAAATLNLSGLIVPRRKTADGILIQAISIAWNGVVRELQGDWSRAFQIPAYKWEELLAASYSEAGFEEVILTPRSGDYGRDVVATKRGVGSIKIIGSMKAYAPGHLVKHDDVRALLGVLSGERDASKAILSTTSDFAPRIKSDPFIKPFLPTRLELMNGNQLRKWLLKLAKK